MPNPVSTSIPLMAKVFISYRREDSAGHAGRLFDRISSYFGNRIKIFMDIDSIAPGEDFVNVIETAVGACEILVAVIGKHWLTVIDETGKRRLDNPDDFVRVEIATALNRNIRVIPVLVQGASMPRREQLPEPLIKLIRRNAIEISDARWKYDADRLIKTIGEALNLQQSDYGDSPASHPARGVRMWWVWPWKILAFILGIGIIWFLVWMLLLYFFPPRAQEIFPPGFQKNGNIHSSPLPSSSSNSNSRANINSNNTAPNNLFNPTPR